MILRQEEKSLQFVIDSLPISGIEDDRYLVVQIGENPLYAGAIKVPGIDIFSYHDADRKMAFYAFGNAVLLSELSKKLVFVGGKANYSDQIRWIGKHEKVQKNEILRNILAFQRRAIEGFGEKNEERFSYILFFSDSKQKIDNDINRFTRSLSLARLDSELCTKEDFQRLYSILLRGENPS